jgi:hypothetical protein
MPSAIILIIGSELEGSAGQNCRRLCNRALGECGGDSLRGDHLLQGCSATTNDAELYRIDPQCGSAEVKRSYKQANWRFSYRCMVAGA